MDFVYLYKYDYIKTLWQITGKKLKVERTTGTDIDKILPPMSRFGGGNRQEKKKAVIEKYFGL